MWWQSVKIQRGSVTELTLLIYIYIYKIILVLTIAGKNTSTSHSNSDYYIKLPVGGLKEIVFSV